ncbi:TRAP transporter small permease [Sporosarcina newyorkensis]|uniref:TRAP transporter small permease n=1 Tax=Sporosarcina newyorkensis TaxID=759851 RepID=UPI003CFCE5C1
MEVIAKTPSKGLELTEKLDKANVYLNNFLAVMAGISLFSMMFLIVGNSIIRNFSVPFMGTTEVVGWLAALTTAFALGHTQRYKGHVVLDLVMDRLPSVIQKLVNIIISIVNIVFFAVVFYQLFLYSLDLKRNGNVSETLVLAYYPLVTLLAIGFFGLLFALVTDLIRDLKRGSHQ